MDEKRIEIVEDINGKITFDEIERKDIDRADVEAAEAEIARIEAENADYLAKVEENNKKLIDIKVKIEFAKRVIAIADEKKAREEAEKEAARLAEEQNEANIANVIPEEIPAEQPQI